MGGGRGCFGVSTSKNNPSHHKYKSRIVSVNRIFEHQD